MYYLNSDAHYILFQEVVNSDIYVDKSLLIDEVTKVIRTSGKYLCITRPRRFGKTVNANMLGAYYTKGYDSHSLFDHLLIAGTENYEKEINRHNVIHIDFSRMPDLCSKYVDYIKSIMGKLKSDLLEAYPELSKKQYWGLNDMLRETGDSFVFILDEWDSIFHQKFMTEDDKSAYMSFLRSLLKDQPYVELAYMTGILPIAKYSSGSELNMFIEYTMATEQRFSEFFGFDDKEVDLLYERYLESDVKPKLVTREALRDWYDGYHTRSGVRLYNPCSIVLSLSNNNIGNYWTSSGPYDEIFYYIENNVAAVRDDLALMVAGIPVKAKIREYAAVSMNLQTKEEIFSAMVVYGFLTYKDGEVSVPNQELMERFADMLQKEESLGYVYNLANESSRMLRATLAGDTDTMAEILEFAHDTEIPLLKYNNETELTALINLVYLSARDTYRVEREDKSGKGYVDFIFYPEKDKDADCIILELKVDHTPDEAIQQIKDKKYALRFKGKLGETSKYKGRILAVGISYDRVEKKHQCKVEELR